MKKIVLLTGAKGSVGSQLRKILDDEFTVIPLERTRANKYSLKNIENQSFKQVTLLHFGAQTPANSIDIDRDFSQNLIQFTELLGDIINITDTIDVINASSMSVYDTVNEEMISEDTKKTNICPYGLSKLRIEEKIKILSQKNKIRNYASLRLPGVLSKNSAEASGNFLSTAISTISTGKDLKIYNKSKLFNNLVTCDDIARLICLLIDVDDFKYQCINMGSTMSNTLGEILEYAKSRLKSQSNIIDLGKKASFTIDINKLIEIGFKPSNPYAGVEYYIKTNKLNT